VAANTDKDGDIERGGLTVVGIAAKESRREDRTIMLGRDVW